MAKYTIEDIEILRQKSGISYEEAVSLMEYHNGSLARALMDLEKNGRMNAGQAASASHKGWKGVFDFLYRLRLVVRKGQATVINLSSLFMLLLIFTAPHICIIGLIVALVLGYRFTIDRDSQAFAKDHFDDMVKNAKSNIKNTVDSFAQHFTKDEEPSTESEPTASQPRSESAPSGTRPVNVQFPEMGTVEVHDDGNGYNEADIH